MSQSDADSSAGPTNAFGRGDIPAVMANFADNIEWNATDVLPHGGHVRGHEGVVDSSPAWPARWSDFALKIDDVVDGGNAVFGRGRASGNLDGTPSGYGFVHVFSMRDG